MTLRVAVQMDPIGRDRKWSPLFFHNLESDGRKILDAAAEYAETRE
jgi:hypothetical protein